MFLSDQIPALMKQASVYVSSAVADGTSPALLEAIAARLTPVVTDIDANRPLVREGEDGFLFNPRDAKILPGKSSRHSQTQFLFLHSMEKVRK